MVVNTAGPGLSSLDLTWFLVVLANGPLVRLMSQICCTKKDCLAEMAAGSPRRRMIDDGYFLFQRVERAVSRRVLTLSDAVGRYSCDDA